MSEDNPFASKKAAKLTRRRVFKIASAAGFSSTAASLLTVDDVKAADSDEVTISLDTEGEYKTNVPADWYDWLRRARAIKENQMNRWENEEGIIGVGVSPGREGGDNPHVTVTLDKHNDKKEEFRGEIPEEQNGVRLDVVEGDHRQRRATACDSDFYDGDPLPGGLRVRIERDQDPDDAGAGSFTSRLINGSDKDVPFGWATAAHVLPTCETSQLFKVYHRDDSSKKLIGWISVTDEIRDFAAISRIPDDDSKHPLDDPPAERVDPLSETAFPESPYSLTLRHEIAGTASQDGLDRIVNLGYKFVLNGITSCRNVAEISTTNSSVVTYPGNFCVTELQDQVRWGTDEDSDEGDSGGPVYSEEVSEAGGDRFFSHVQSGFAPIRGYSFGPAGYAIRNQHNMWWDDL